MPSVIRRTKRWQRWMVYAVVVIYGFIPAVVLVFPRIASYIALSYSLPFYFGDLRDPASLGLKATRHIDLATDTGDILGLWHMLPESFLEEEKPFSDGDFDSHLASGTPIVIFVHGSGGTRGQFTRVLTCTAIRGQNWHVVTFDFRGFGDSTGVASESNMVEDTVTVYRWVKKRSLSSPVFLWGHSLGTGVVAHAARVLSSKGETPSGIVLESAFTNISDLLEVTLITLPYQPFPFLLRIFTNALKRESLSFTSDEHLIHVKCPILLLHAEDDRTVPVHLVHKLFLSVTSRRQKGQPGVTLHVFPGGRGYGHNFLSQAPDLGSVVRQFVQDLQKNVAKNIDADLPKTRT